MDKTRVGNMVKYEVERIAGEVYGGIVNDALDTCEDGIDSGKTSTRIQIKVASTTVARINPGNSHNQAHRNLSKKDRSLVNMLLLVSFNSLIRYTDS